MRREHDDWVNIGWMIVIVVVTWSMLSVIVALAVGSMAKARDTGATPLLDHSMTAGRMPPPARDENIRAAI